MKKILKLSLIFSVLSLIFASCSRDNEGDGEVANAPKPKITAVGITVETLSVKRTYERDSEWAVIEYKVTGKRQAGTETTHPYIFYGVKRSNGSGFEFDFEELKDPSAEPNGYYTGTMKVGGILGSRTLDFSDIRAAVGDMQTSF